MSLIAFEQILTMVILMAVGVACCKIRLIDEETNKKLSSFVLLLVNPIVIFLSYQRAFEAELLKGLWISVCLAVISYSISLAVAHLIYRNRDGNNFAIEKFANVYSNAGFIGIPLINGVIGSEGIFYLTAYLTMFNVLVWTHGIVVMSGNITISFIKKALLSPALIAVFLGFAFFILEVSIPRFILQPIQLLGYTNTPLAMIVAGVSLSQTNIFKILKDVRIYKVCFIRLLLIPALFLVVANFFGFPTVIVGTILIATGCPVAVSIILFAHRYDKDYLYAAELFAGTTVCSMVTIPLLLMLL